MVEGIKILSVRLTRVKTLLAGSQRNRPSELRAKRELGSKPECGARETTLNQVETAGETANLSADPFEGRLKAIEGPTFAAGRRISTRWTMTGYEFLVTCIVSCIATYIVERCKK